MDKIKIIIQELVDSKYKELIDKQDYPGLAKLLNTKPLIDNPDPVKQIPAQLKTIDFVNAVTAEELTLVLDVPGMLDNLRNAVNSRDIETLTTSFAIISKILGTNLSDASKLNIQSLLTSTIDDPNYSAQIQGVSRAEELNIYPVFDSDIQAALNPIEVISDDFN